MTRLLRALALCGIMVWGLAACNLGSGDPIPNQVIQAQSTAALSALVKIVLTVQADAPSPLVQVGQVIKYKYRIRNTGSTGVPASPADVIIAGATVTCPAVNTIGNNDNTLDNDEILVCTSEHAITQADIDQGSVQTSTTASVSGNLSKPVTTTVQVTPLVLNKTVDPATYDHAGQQITYSYVITNGGAKNLSPDQFKVSDDGLAAPVNCGDPNTTLAPNATVTCKATYLITAADLNADSVSSKATASGGGAAPSQPASASITKSTVVQPNPNPNPNPNPANLPVGSTIQHQVADGEWLWQIARCYGADPKKTIQANPQLASPEQISPKTVVNVPNIGSVGPIYGPPCVLAYTVKSGDTWNSIAQRYNADAAVLQMVNPNGLAVGNVIDVPLNSGGGIRPTATP